MRVSLCCEVSECCTGFVRNNDAGENVPDDSSLFIITREYFDKMIAESIPKSMVEAERFDAEGLKRKEYDINYLGRSKSVHR